jgi:hypothetical protein
MIFERNYPHDESSLTGERCPRFLSLDSNLFYRPGGLPAQSYGPLLFHGLSSVVPAGKSEFVESLELHQTFRRFRSF